MTPVSGTAHPATLSVAGMKAMVDSFVTERLAALTAESAKVTASTRLTTAQKADVQARIAAEVAARIDASVAWLTALVGKVQASTRLTDPQKATMVAKLQAKITKLTALRAGVATATSSKAVLADLRAAQALWLVHPAKDGHHAKKGDPRLHHQAAGKVGGKVEGAVWWKAGYRAHDPNGVRVVAAGRGHAASCAGHHGFGSHHRPAVSAPPDGPHSR
jgi:hypothetical protein